MSGLQSSQSEHHDEVWIPHPFFQHMKNKGNQYDQILVEYFPPITDMEIALYLGNFAWTGAYEKVQYIIRSHAIDVGGYWVTPPKLAREYIMWKLPNWRGRVTGEQKRIVIDQKRHAPLYAQSGVYQNMVHVDLRSAYWQIVRSVGIDLDYYPEKWLRRGIDVSDFPMPENRIARSSLVSVGIPTRGVMWDGSKLLSVPPMGKYVNLMLYHFVMDVLNGIAADMLSIGAVYVHTDGYVIPQCHEQLAFEIADSWGLELRAKARGNAHIVHVGKYSVGDVATRNYRSYDTEHSFSNVMSVNRRWLKLRMRKFSSLHS